MSEEQIQALAKFGAYYGHIEDAVDAEDAERVAELVIERGAALSELLAAFSGQLLPEPVRAHIEGSEAQVRVRLVRFYDSILLRLSDERRRNYATSRYLETVR